MGPVGSKKIPGSLEADVGCVVFVTVLCDVV